MKTPAKVIKINVRFKRVTSVLNGIQITVNKVVKGGRIHSKDLTKMALKPAYMERLESSEHYQSVPENSKIIPFIPLHYVYKQRALTAKFSINIKAWTIRNTFGACLRWFSQNQKTEQLEKTRRQSNRMTRISDVGDHDVTDY